MTEPLGDRMVLVDNGMFTGGIQDRHADQAIERLKA